MNNEFHSNPVIPDEYILSSVARWSVAKLKAELAWAEGDLNELYGMRESESGSSNCPTKELEELKAELQSLTGMEPKSVRGAFQMLNVVYSILEHKENDPESVLGSGPALGILRQIRDALETTEQDVSVGYLSR